MNLALVFILIILILYGVFSIYMDIKTRKVPNYINLSFFIVSFAIFIAYIPRLEVIDFVVLVICLILSFLFHLKKIWGAADGKIFMSISLILISYFDLVLYFNFLINLLLFYVLCIVILSSFLTRFEEKKKIFLNINYGETIFVILCAFVLISIFISRIDLTVFSDYYLLLVLIFVFVFMFFFRKFTKKFYSRINDDISFFVNIFLFFLVSVFGGLEFVYYFVFVFLIRVLIDFLSKVVGKIKVHRKKYSSPFSVYLFLSSLFTIFLDSNIIVVLRNFFLGFWFFLF